MAARPLPPIEFLRECFSYDPTTGLFAWRHRPEYHFRHAREARSWNSLRAGKPAFIGSVKRGYKVSHVRYEGRGVHLMAHRVAYKFLTGEEPETVDHQDTDTGNNRAENLRAATYGQNTANRRGWSKHGLPKGVYPYRQRFKANVTTGSGPTKKTIHLGVFDTPAEAHAAYCEAASAVHGEFFNPGPARPSVFD